MSLPLDASLQLSTVLSFGCIVAALHFVYLILRMEMIPLHDDALEAYIATPRHATHGMWSSAQHVGVMRALYLRSFRFAQRHVGAAGASRHLQALSEVANSGNVMRAVLRFAVPYCTPTRAEQRAICRTCHINDDTTGLARWLISSRGVDPSTVDFDGDSLPLNRGAPLLLIAARQGHVGLIDELVRCGADVDQAKATGWTSLIIAAQNGHLAVVTMLIAAGALVDKATTEGATPLYVAAQNGHLTVLTKLIAAGADVDKARTTDGITPLHIAAEYGHLTVVTKLIAAGALVNKARTDVGSTPLFTATNKGHLTMVTKLIAAGADVNKAETIDGCTPLWMAAQEGYTAIVSKLLQHGADKSIRGWHNETPVEAAQRGNHAATIALLNLVETS